MYRGGLILQMNCLALDYFALDEQGSMLASIQRGCRRYPCLQCEVAVGSASLELCPDAGVLPLPSSEVSIQGVGR